MPEDNNNHKQERILEEPSVTTSDEAIKAVVNQLRSEIGGLPNSPIVLEGQILVPITDVSPQTEEGPVPNRIIAIPGKIGPRDSCYGLIIHTQRQKAIAARKTT